MGKFKWILICGALVLAFGANAAAAGSNAKVFLQEDGTTEFSATLATFVSSLTEGTRTAISVSNTLATPVVEGIEFGGFPTGGDTEGAVWAFCYNTLGDDEPTPTPHEAAPWVYSSSLNGVVGTGLTEDGVLMPGSTWIVFADEILATLGFDAETENFVGYCYFVGEFDAIAGTYVNTFVSVSSQQAFPMQADFAGVPIDVSFVEEPTPQ